MTQTTSDRMRQLQTMLQKEPNDTFLLYGLALEYKKSNDAAHAIEFLDRVLKLDAGYCYAYHQKGLAYESLGDVEAAKRTYREGMDAARKKGDEHARQEIEAALTMIE
jgi:Tfp pilus assembly protein PilF